MDEELVKIEDVKDDLLWKFIPARFGQEFRLSVDFNAGDKWWRLIAKRRRCRRVWFYKLWRDSTT